MSEYAMSYPIFALICVGIVCQTVGWIFETVCNAIVDVKSKERIK